MLNFAIDSVEIYYKKEMKKIIIASLISIVAIVTFSSCNNSKTYAQYLDEEKKKIERFIDKNDIKVLSEYPKDSVFQENEFFFDSSTGIYYNVIDSGNGRRIEVGEEFYVRYKGLSYIESNDTTKYSNIKSMDPEELIYGNSATYITAAWIIPLRNVGDRAKVKMIVPFKMGTAGDQSRYSTGYYEEIDYRFELIEEK